MYKWILGLGLAVGVAGACVYDYKNPAESLALGEIRGKVVMPDPAAAQATVGAEGAVVKLRGSAYELRAKKSGLFAFFDLPAGKYTLTMKLGGSGRAVTRLVEVPESPEGRSDGVTIGNVLLTKTATLSGKIQTTDATGAVVPVAGATVVDELTITEGSGFMAKVTTAADGSFTLPDVPIGNEAHTLRAYWQDPVSGELKVASLTAPLTPADEGQTKALEPAALEKANPDPEAAHIHLKPVLATPKSVQGDFKVVVKDAVTGVPVPSVGEDRRIKPGQFEDIAVPEGIYKVALEWVEESPAGGIEREVRGIPETEAFPAIGTAPLDLGILTAVDEESFSKIEGLCESNADCAVGICSNGKCTEPQPEPQLLSACLQGGFTVETMTEGSFRSCTAWCGRTELASCAIMPEPEPGLSPVHCSCGAGGSWTAVESAPTFDVCAASPAAFEEWLVGAKCVETAAPDAGTQMDGGTTVDPKADAGAQVNCMPFTVQPAGCLIVSSNCGSVQCDFMSTNATCQCFPPGAQSASKTITPQISMGETCETSLGRYALPWLNECFGGVQ